MIGILLKCFFSCFWSLIFCILWLFHWLLLAYSCFVVCTMITELRNNVFYRHPSKRSKNAFFQCLFGCWWNQVFRFHHFLFCTIERVRVNILWLEYSDWLNFWTKSMPFRFRNNCHNSTQLNPKLGRLYFPMQTTNHTTTTKPSVNFSQLLHCKVNND